MTHSRVRSLSPQDRDPAAGDGIIDAAAAGNRGVEAAGNATAAGSEISYCIAATAETLPRTSAAAVTENKVTGPGRGAEAGVQHHQPRHRPGLAQQVDQPVRRDQVGTAVLAHQGQHALVPLGVEIPVPESASGTAPASDLPDDDQRL